MSMTVMAREDARLSSGRFGEQVHSGPEAGLNIAQAQSLIAATTIHHEAPIGARQASLVVDEATGKITFLRYTDERGLTVTTDQHDDFNETLAGADADSFAAQPGVSRREIDGETWFAVDLEEDF